MIPWFRSCLPALACCLAWTVSAASVQAHALLLDSTPTPKAVVSGASQSLTLRFNSRIDASRSRLSLSDSAGKALSLPARLGASKAELRANAEGLAPGAYVLHWEVLSVDGHISRGDLPFTVTEAKP